MKTGKLAPKVHPKAIQLGQFIDPALPPAPRKVYWEYKVKRWGMMRNDAVSCCTMAAAGHMIMNFTAHTGAMITPTDEQIIKAYSDVTGYNPITGANDNGAPCTDVLEYWRTIGIADHKIEAWAQVDHTKHESLLQGIWLFGGLYVGVNMYESAMMQVRQGKAWDLPNGGNSSGHCVPIMGSGEDGMTCITWALLQQMGLPWLLANLDEAYIVITEDWLDKATKKTPSGLYMAGLNQAIVALRS